MRGHHPTHDPATPHVDESLLRSGSTSGSPTHRSFARSVRNCSTRSGAGRALSSRRVVVTKRRLVIPRSPTSAAPPNLASLRSSGPAAPGTPGVRRTIRPRPGEWCGCHATGASCARLDAVPLSHAWYAPAETSSTRRTVATRCSARWVLTSSKIRAESSGSPARTRPRLLPGSRSPHGASNLSAQMAERFFSAMVRPSWRLPLSRRVRRPLEAPGRAVALPPLRVSRSRGRGVDVPGSKRLQGAPPPCRVGDPDSAPGMATASSRSAFARRLRA